ncbi:M15 family metallopeptidase [Coxiella-like endosymbiont]|uniref:M15 family metallopeptidase n=1 Tax=Coxiella-like endosymbiont TaxID=1592897 RepID=UPI00272B6D32|nr:M15 family metallopeptidase [Coxiella-like endosymbiont]
MCETVRKEHPDWIKENIKQEARKYAAYPNDSSRFAISPHNSERAVDFAIGHSSHSGQAWAFGTEFDEVSELSRTDFLKKNRISNLGLIPNSGIYIIVPIVEYFFYLMIHVGFINYRNELWHYNL